MNRLQGVFPNALHIALREYRSRVRSRSFVFGTALLCVLGFAGAQVPVLVSYIAGGTTRLAVYSDASNLPPDAMAVLTGALNGQTGSSPNEKLAFEPTRVSSLAEAERQLQAGEVSAVFVIGRDPATKELTFSLEADTPSDSREAALAQDAATSLAIEDRLARAGVSLADVLAPANVAIDSPGGKGPPGQQRNDSLAQSTNLLLTSALIALMMIAILMYGVWVAMSVAEEKGSRVMELMLNAATPLQMLAGKVIGNGAAGLTQYGVAVIVAFAGLLVQDPIARLLGVSGGTSFAGLSPWQLAAFVVLFLLGFLLYALLYAGLGSLVSRQEDIQSATAPLMILVMSGYFVSLLNIAGMDGPWAVALSYVPFFSPYMLMGRMTLGHVAPWEFAIVVVLMLAASAIALWFAARLYGAGVLLYGQRPSLRKLFAAARSGR